MRAEQLAQHWVKQNMERVRRMYRDADWELYDFTVNRQDRKVTIRNIIKLGFAPRDAIEMVCDCEREG